MSNKNNLVDLLKNISFLKWLRKEDGADTAHWEKWQQENPANIQSVDDAKLIIKGIPFKKQVIGNKETKANWEKISSKLNQPRPNLTTALAETRSLQPNRPSWLKIAATITFLVLSSWGIFAYLHQSKLIRYETDFAENKTVELPDGTEITLAANSSLAFYDNFEKADSRKVELLGEAYFKVAKQPVGKQFIVAVKDLSVRVVGTAFNVNSHRENSIVSLMEGKVVLAKDTIAEQQLLAGQTAVFNTNTSKFDLISDQTNYWTDWRMQKWSFGDETPMKEVIQRIEETFGLSVQCEDSAILARQASGSIDIDNQEVLLESLSYLLDLEFEIKDKVLWIRLKEEVDQ